VSAKTATLQMGRLAAAGIHLLASAAVAAAGALLIFKVWYPAPFDVIAGGTTLFLLLVSVDVVLGPALTFVAASPGKPRREFRNDLAVIVALQIAAFAYGVYTIALARPVFESFEVDRFHVVTAGDVESDQLAKAPPELRSLPWTGPKLIAAVKPTDPAEQLKSMELGMAGLDLSMFPGNWRPYDSQRHLAWERARPARELTARHPKLQIELTHIAEAEGKPVADLRFLPLVSRQVSWVAVLAPPDARVVGYLPVDGFF
jgi:hypothetical protein